MIGLNYACQTFDRFSALNLMFNSLASQAVQIESTELIKAVLKIYVRLVKKHILRHYWVSSKRPEGLFTDEVGRLISIDEECEALFQIKRTVVFTTI